MKAIYTSVWDDDTPFESSCDYDPITNRVTNVEECDVDGEDICVCTDEYILLPDGTRIDRENFLLEDEDF